VSPCAGEGPQAPLFFRITDPATIVPYFINIQLYILFTGQKNGKKERKCSENSLSSEQKFTLMIQISANDRKRKKKIKKHTDLM